MWGIDSASVAELALTSNRPETTHDPQFGIRFNIAPNVGGSAGITGCRAALGAAERASRSSPVTR
jgi:hypothetical protein